MSRLKSDGLVPKTQIGWQVFRRIGTRPYDTLAGWCISLVRYELHCADCGKPFEGLATRGNWRKRKIRRRCVTHRSVGRYVDNMAPPVLLSSLPHWARPNRKPERLKASLGRRQSHCGVLPPKSKLRIIEPVEMTRLLAERDVKWRAALAAMVARRRLGGAAPPSTSDDRPSYLD